MKHTKHDLLASWPGRLDRHGRGVARIAHATHENTRIAHVVWRSGHYTAPHDERWAACHERRAEKSQRACSPRCPSPAQPSDRSPQARLPPEVNRILYVRCVALRALAASAACALRSCARAPTSLLTPAPETCPSTSRRMRCMTSSASTAPSGRSECALRALGVRSSIPHHLPPPLQRKHEGDARHGVRGVRGHIRREGCGCAPLPESAAAPARAHALPQRTT